jgi:hypothetical protein
MSGTKIPPGYIGVSSPASTYLWSAANVTHTPDLDQGAALRAERDAAIKRAEEAEVALATVQGEGVAAWRPIATAPKDGARVLLWYAPTRIDKGEAVEGFWDALFDGQWMTSRGASFIDGRLRQPTHWMPLPSGPAEGA